ncbi:hypothetical protein COO60DRAFT_1488212 [Scenedesmus sp. NREL 46B-D3]|nr:hypothetical protein COO60DRAFT_1488212 [Scenedesmus sp. NREL 46B-D3]
MGRAVLWPTACAGLYGVFARARVCIAVHQLHCTHLGTPANLLSFCVSAMQWSHLCVGCVRTAAAVLGPPGTLLLAGSSCKAAQQLGALHVNAVSWVHRGPRPCLADQQHLQIFQPILRMAIQLFCLHVVVTSIHFFLRQALKWPAAGQRFLSCCSCRSVRCRPSHPAPVGTCGA